MEGARSLTLSAAIIVLICFFLPWIQVSCGGSHDTSSGLELARGGDNVLWLIPVLMIALIIVGCGVIRGLSASDQPTVFGLLSLLSGLVSAYLMHSERSRFANTSALIAVSSTGWFWVGFLSSIAIAVCGIISVPRLSRSP